MRWHLLTWVRRKTAAESEALDTLDQVAHGPKCFRQFMLSPGDMLFFSNYTVLHNRTAFVDDDDLDKRRHLLRLWLRAHDPRPLIENISGLWQAPGNLETGRPHEHLRWGTGIRRVQGPDAQAVTNESAPLRMNSGFVVSDPSRWDEKYRAASLAPVLRVESLFQRHQIDIGELSAPRTALDIAAGTCHAAVLSCETGFECYGG